MTPVSTKQQNTDKNRKPRRLLVMYCLLIISVLAASAGLGYLWLGPHSATGGQPHLASLPSRFQPVVGDVHDPEDNDPDITVQQAQAPGFQFQHGGYTLSGMVTDVQTGQRVPNAVVWIDLPIHQGQRTSTALHTVTDAQGSYQFAHLATGNYTVVASRYYDVGDGRYYAERIFSSIGLLSNRSGLLLPLTALALPGKRSIAAGQAKNLILIDVRGFYAASLLNDPLLVNQTQNLRAFLQSAHVASSVWQPYGWRPLDQYALLTGTSPQWATYDPWPHEVPWGMPDNIDTTFWFTSDRNAHLFGQESIFDVAKGYGMQTGVVAGADYFLSDATTRSLDVFQRSSTFDAEGWLAQIEGAVLSGGQQANGFLLYGELAPLLPQDGSSSPDAAGDAYQQALSLADTTFGRFMTWLSQQGLLQNTLIALTTSQAQANHTDADNFYGMGATGGGTSKQTLLALAGPGVCAPAPKAVENTSYSGFIVAPVLMHLLGLPAPTEAYLPATGGCLSVLPLLGGELASGLHRNSEYRSRRSALASLTDASRATDKCPVLA